MIDPTGAGRLYDPIVGIFDEWRRANGAVLPRVSPSRLRLAVAWEIQARAGGGLPRSVTAVLEPAYATRVVRLASLSPAVNAAIRKGAILAEVNATNITAPDAIPACGKAQASAMLAVGSEIRSG